MKNRKGVGGVEVIIITGVLIFIILPMSYALMHRIYVRSRIDRFNEIADMAVLSVISHLDTASLSDKQFLLNNQNQLEENIRWVIKESLSDRDELIALEVDLHQNNEYCTMDHTSEYPFFHILMTLNMEHRIFMRTHSMIQVHTDLEIPFGGIK